MSENGNQIRLVIKDLAEAQGISLYEVAKRAGLGYPLVHKLANAGTTGIQFDKLEALATALKVKPSELISP